ncbi:hypothetical protein L9Z41_09265 [Leptospira noguchii]|uniref:hypothetical protein n=1 Tax=Leptospira noguchii TaxID=28182 RepID=UPI00030C0BE4|nr:hypothetical protein [Leptospira noguchii]MCH1912150.1 hypothetical protein [Leptospira noguchii]MCH1915820.1 hypothetical protein [Leptospira noguchii]UOG63262.1 hypothetical protein MAL04_13145 [Leptospira noguchii]
MKKRKTFLLTVLILCGACISVRQQTLSSEIPEVSRSRNAKLLSAFFGLDNALPFQSLLRGS